MSLKEDNGNIMVGFLPEISKTWFSMYFACKPVRDSLDVSSGK